MRRGGWQETRLERLATWDASVVRAVPSVVLLMAVGLIAISLFDMEMLRGFLDRQAPDGELTLLDQFSNAQIVASLRELAVVTTVIAVMLWTFRLPIVGFLAGPSAATTETGYARVVPAELVVASAVFAAWAVLAASNLSLSLRADEATTFLAFASRPMWIAWSDYFAPNNHILHSFLVRIAYLVEGWNLTALRMPAFLAACFTLPALWWFVRQEYGWLAAALVTVLFATSPFFIEYATNARGYTLLILFFLLSLLCGRSLVRRPDANGLWMLQALVISLGFLAIPLMVFPATIVPTWMLILRYRESGIVGLLPFTVKMVAWFCIALALTLILYTPVLVVSGFDALFNNSDVKAGPWSFGTWIQVYMANLIVPWFKWHMATPFWVQAAFVAMIVIGVVVPRLPTGYRGVFPVAAVIGTAIVLLVKPVVLPARMTIFLFLVSNIIIGAGTAFLIEAVLARLRRSALILDVTRGGIVALVLGGSAWWASQPGIAERFAIETGFSPTAKALVDSVLHDLLPGDIVLASFPTASPVGFYIVAAGRNLTRIDVDTVPPIGRRVRGYQINGTRPNNTGRFFLFVDLAASDVFPTQQELRVRHFIDNQTVLKYLETGGYCYQVVADLPGGRVYRFTVTTSPSATTFSTPTRQVTGRPQKHCVPI